MKHGCDLVAQIIVPGLVWNQHPHQDVISIDLGEDRELIRLFGLLVAGLCLGTCERLLVRSGKEGYSIVAGHLLDGEHRERLAKSQRVGVALDKNALEYIIDFSIRGTVGGLFVVNHLDLCGTALESGRERYLTIMGFPTSPPDTSVGIVPEHGK